MAGNDGAGVTTYAMAGARFGYAILITLIPLTILYTITQEMGSRVAIVAGRGLADLIRERFGIRIAVLMFFLLAITNFGTTLSNVAALKVSGNMLGLPTTLFIFFSIGVSFIIITAANYRTTQKIFLLGGVLYLSYVFAAIKGQPDWGDALKGLVVPSKEILSGDFILGAIAIIGTTITPWGQFFVQSYMKDKNVPITNLRFAKLEAFFGATLSNVFTFFIIVATAATLYMHHIPLASGEQAALAIRPFAGELSGLLFAFGLMNAAIIGMIIVSLSTAYAFSEFFGFEGTLDKPFRKSRLFYGFFLTNLIIAALIAINPYVSLFKIVFFTQTLNAILLPVVLFFTLKIVNNKSIMGPYTNTKFDNIVSIVGSIVLVIAIILAVISGVLGNI